MSEQNSAQSSTKQRKSRKTNTANHGNDKQTSATKRPINEDIEVWKAYWKTQGQPWRTQPEIDAEQQKYLEGQCRIQPDIQRGIYPFKDVKLSRADVEWLLATHENGRGPVDWSDESQREREGLDLRGADLRQVDLNNLPLASTRGGLTWWEWDSATEEQRAMAAAHLEGASLIYTHLENAQFNGTYLAKARFSMGYIYQGDKTYLAKAHFWDAFLEEAIFCKVHLEGVAFSGAHLAGTDFGRAHLEGAYFSGASLNRETNLSDARLDRATFYHTILCDKDSVGPIVFVTDWGKAGLDAVQWSQIKMLGDEYKARQKMQNGQIKDKGTRLNQYESAVRANRKLAIALQEQGMNEDAARFAYRAQVLQRVVWRRQRSWLKYAFSWFLAVVAGYGYKPYRCFVIYFLALMVFTLAHYIVGALVGSPLTFINALAVSVQSLHGRLFSFQSSDPQTLLNTIEAFVGLFIEAIVVAVITQRILGK